jgi:hypothetical protein
MTQENQEPSVLDYGQPLAFHRRWALPLRAAAGGIVGAIVMLLLFGILSVGGPVFPLTLAFAPTWIPIELRLDMERWVAFLWLLGGCPALYALYGALTALPRRTRLTAIAALFHVLCFLVVCWLRDVWTLL